MTTANPQPLPPRRRRSPLLAVLAIGAGVGVFTLGLLILGLTSYLRVGRDVKALRDSLRASAAVRWDKKIEVNVGAFTLGVARACLSFADSDLDREARKALGALRAAEVGVYHLRDRRRRLDNAALLSAADEAMAARGWERLVGVSERRDLVAIYVPRDARSERDIKACMAIVNNREVVVAAGRGDLEPLMDLALRELQHLSLPVGRRSTQPATTL